MLPDRLTKIDETTRDQYYFLDPDDDCYYFGDFYSHKGWSYGATNQLIKNYKRGPEEIRGSNKARQLQYYKDQAIAEVARALRVAISAQTVAAATFVPIPTSRVRSDPDYCDRLERTLRSAFGNALDLRFLLRQTANMTADHLSGGARSSYEALLNVTEIDAGCLAAPMRPRVILFDDVLTSGKHYKVGKARIQEALPGQGVLGVFVARSIHRNPFDEFDNLDLL